MLLEFPRMLEFFLIFRQFSHYGHKNLSLFQDEQWPHTLCLQIVVYL
ncbi:hypothetical protein CP10743SC13_0594, partial [Chlamydia psittaci 10_743_SC13]